MKKVNLIAFVIFFFGFFQLIWVYKNFRLMNKIADLEEKKNVLMIKIKKKDILLDSLSTISYSLLCESLEIKLNNTFSSESLFLPEIVKKENGEE